MTTFGKRSGSGALGGQRPEAASDLFARRYDPTTQADPAPTREELDRVVFWEGVITKMSLYYWAIVLSIGLVFTLVPLVFTLVPFVTLLLWLQFPVLGSIGNLLVMLFAVSVVLMTCVALYGRTVIQLHEARYPRGYKAYMYKHPSVYFVGIVLGVVAFGLLSDHSLTKLVTEFSVTEMLLLDSRKYDEPRPWADMWQYLIYSITGTAILFYTLDKYLSARERVS